MFGKVGAAALLFFSWNSVSSAGDTTFSGSVVSILDGDTIQVLHNKHTERIRLRGIDCPEKGHAYGNKAKQATSALVFGKVVMLQTYCKDKYKRILADVLLPNERRKEVGSHCLANHSKKRLLLPLLR